jgi:hypothetical protein
MLVRRVLATRMEKARSATRTGELRKARNILLENLKEEIVREA